MKTKSGTIVLTQKIWDKGKACNREECKGPTENCVLDLLAQKIRQSKDRERRSQCHYSVEFYNIDTFAFTASVKFIPSDVAHRLAQSSDNSLDCPFELPLTLDYSVTEY